MRARRRALIGALTTGLLAVTMLVAGGGGAAPVAAASAAAAPSGTIVYLKGHDIWLARGDGSGRYQVTFDGTASSPYYSPTMSDGGVIAAGKGQHLVRMRQNGTVINRINPPSMTNSVGHPVDGPPVNVAISPDGTRIAFTMVSFSCPVAADCLARGVTGVTSATRLTGPTMRSYYWEPSWVTNSRLMVHGGYGSHIRLQDASGGAQHWFDDSDIHGDFDSTDLGDAALSRDGTSLVAVRGYGADKQLISYRVNGNARSGAVTGLANPTPLCLSGTDAKLAETDWSPDGRAVVTADSEGLVVMYPGSPCGTTTYTRIGAGSEPSWSPATLRPGLRQFGMKARPSFSGKLKVGRRQTAAAGRWAPSPANVQYRWLRNGKAIKRATNRRYVLERADRGKRISVRVKVSRSGYQARLATSVRKRVR